MSAIPDEDIEGAVIDLRDELRTSPRWTLPTQSNALITAPDGHLHVLHRESLTRLLDTIDSLRVRLEAAKDAQ